MPIDPNNFLHSLALFMAAAAGVSYAGSTASTTHYLSTAENSGTLATILPADLKAKGFKDDGMAQNGSIDRARAPVATPPASYCRPPDPTAWQNLADVAAARGISITVEAEGILRYAFDTWQSDNAACKAVMADVATGLGYMKAKQPGVPLWVEHQSQLAANLPAPAGYADFVIYEAGLLSPLIAGCTVMGYYTAPSVAAIDFAAWDAVQDFYRATLATYYPGKRVKIFASSYLYDGLTDALYVGDAAMQHVVDYALANDCDVEWWSASTTAPLHAEAWAFLRALQASGARRALWLHLAPEAGAADPYSVLRPYGGTAQGHDPLERISAQCMTTGKRADETLARAWSLRNTLRAADGTPLRMKVIPALKVDGTGDAPSSYQLTRVDAAGAPGLIGIDDRKRHQASFNFDVAVAQV